MIVVRNVFRVKFGQAKEATAHWKQAMEIMRRQGFDAAGPSRLLTDLAGPPFYTLVLESTFESLAHFEKLSQAARSSPDFAAVYAKIAALTETGHREILSVVA